MTKNDAGPDKLPLSDRQADAAIAELRVSNPLGLHTHPSTELAKLVLASGCQVSVTCVTSGEVAQGHSILALLSLGASQGTLLRVCVEGETAQRVLADIKALFSADPQPATY